MQDFIQNFRTKIAEIYSRLETRQKIVLGVLLIASFAVFIWLISWSTKEEYSLLFGNMDPKEANEAIKKLDELNIKYKLSNAGKSILIPKELVYSTRIKLSSEGISSKGGVGFEIFDKPNLGTTEAVQKLNRQRALEGELQRTITSIEGVEYVRVHLQLPEEKLFQEDQQKPSASVLIHSQRKLTSNQVEGITNLIASAVEGLEVSAITVTDRNGNILTENFDDSVSGLSNAQLKIQRRVESDLKHKVQTMMDKLVEPGNSEIRVSVDLNFDKIESTMEKFDPDSKVTRSEEIENVTSEMAADSISESSEHLITNYEINRTVQHVFNSGGNIKRLSISVTVNHRINYKIEDGVEVKEYTERTQEDLEQIESLVRTAVGFSAERGDAIVVNSRRFETANYDKWQREQKQIETRGEMMKMVETGVILLILVILIFTLISQFRKVFAQPAEPEEDSLRPVLAHGDIDQEGFYPEGEEGLPMGEGKISYTFKPMKDIEIEQTETMALQESVKTFILENPEVAVKLIKSWILEKRA